MSYSAIDEFEKCKILVEKEKDVTLSHVQMQLGWLSYFSHANKVVHIEWARPTLIEKFIDIALHELAHAAQDVLGELVTRRITTTIWERRWKGEVIIDTLNMTMIEYYDLPWETEATLLSIKLSGNVTNQNREWYNHYLAKGNACVLPIVKQEALA